MAENTYSVGYATNARSKCKYSKCDEKDIQKDDLRFSKGSASASSDRAPKFEYYHAKCMFMSFVSARKTTKKIESMSDMEGVDNLKSADKELIKKLLKEWKSGSLKDQVPKTTRKRKADGEDADDKKKKKKTTNSASKKTKKDESDDEEEEEYKPKKSRFIKDDDDEEDDSPKSKKTKKPVKEESESEDSEEEDDKKFNQILKGKSNNTKKTIQLDDSSEEEEKKPAKPSAKTSKKKSSESDEEVQESESSAEEPKEDDEEEGNSDKFLSGKIIAVVGKFSMPREKIVALIEKNGGKYVKNVTKEVTHVVAKDNKMKTVIKAKEDGKIIVTESFLKRGQ